MGPNDAGVSYIELRAKMDQLQRDVKSAGALVDRQITGQTRQLGGKLGTWTKNHWAGIARSGGAVLAAGAGFAVKEFIDAEKVAAQTEARLESTGGAAKVTADEIESLAGALMTKSGVDDEAIQSGENLLLTFTAIRNEVGKGNDIFNQAASAALDLSVAMGTDMQSASLQVGKALQDPVRGLTALRRSGVAFSSEQEDLIKSLVESGDTMAAQKVILAELRKEFGGAAKAAGDTLGGKLNRLKESALNAGGALAEHFEPQLEAVTDGLQTYADLVSEASKAGERHQESVDASYGSLVQFGRSLEAGTFTVEQYSERVKELIADESLDVEQKRELAEASRQMADNFRRGINITNGLSAAFDDGRVSVMGMRIEVERLLRGINNFPTDLPMPGSHQIPSEESSDHQSHKGGLASGGPAQPFRAYWVGERGPEILQMGSQGGTVIPNHKLGATNVITLNVYTNRGEDVIRTLRRELDRLGA